MTDRTDDQPQRLTHQRVWRLAGPVILSNLSVPLLGAVDTAVMGHLPDPAYIGGVAIAQIIFNYLYWGFGFLRMGTTGLTAQAFGARDSDEMRALLARAGLIALIIALALLLLQGPIGQAAFLILEASDKVEDQARIYYAIRIWGAPATLAVYAIIGWLFGQQRMIGAVVVTVVMNTINIVLDLLFVIGFGMGIDGVALATVIAEYSGVALGLVLVGFRLHRIGGVWLRKRILDRAKLIALVRVNADIFVRTLCLVTGFAWFTAQGARFGDEILAANAILMTFMMFAGYGLDGFAHAAEALVGNALGARDRRALSRAVRLTTIWAAIVAAGFTLVYALAGPLIIAAMTNIEAVRVLAMTYLPWAVMIPVCAVWSFQLDGIFIGATRTAEMRNGMILSLAGLLVLGYTLMPIWANHGLWLAMLCFMILRALTLGLWYPRIPRAAETASHA